MTCTLVLMRHAKSSWDDPFQPDHERPLNTRGRASAKAIGDWLRRTRVTPTLCLSSTSRRTRETFDGLGLDCPARYIKALYHASAEQIYDVLSDVQDHKTVLMLGHNPGIASFAARIVAQPASHTRFVDYPTCATTVITFDVTCWKDIGWHTGQPIHFAIPREL